MVGRLSKVKGKVNDQTNCKYTIRITLKVLLMYRNDGVELNPEKLSCTCIDEHVNLFRIRNILHILHGVGC